MTEYYYLKASLPYLRLEKVPPITSRDFLDECLKWVSPKDLEKIENAKFGNQNIEENEAEASLNWKRFDTELKTGIALARKKAKIFGKKIRKMVKEIINQETPLDSEKEIERIRWEYLEDKEALYEFDINALIIYFLKLQIIERLTSFDKEEGENFFYKLCEVKYEQTKG